MDIEEGHIAIIGVIATLNIALVAPLYKIFFGDHVHRSEIDTFRKEIWEQLVDISKQIRELEHRLGRIEGRLDIHIKEEIKK